jgi:hypothetical protein
MDKEEERELVALSWSKEKTRAYAARLEDAA